MMGGGWDCVRLEVEGVGCGWEAIQAQESLAGGW